MATMIPDIDPALIENNGEQRFYEAARELPAAYIVYYSYKFSAGEHAENPTLIYEADFIIVHPRLGYLVVEVKEGQYQYFNNRWQKQLGREFVEVEKDPVAQAERAMYSILTRHKKETKKSQFPLKIKYAVCFPDCNKLAGTTPENLKPESILLLGNLEKLDAAIRAIFKEEADRAEEEAVAVLNKILAPSFKLFNTLEAEMQRCYSSAEKVLTEEQKRILDETAYDKRKIFLGAAGTGKTYIAMEKVRRLVKDNRRVLLTCFNRNLGELMRRDLADEIATGLLKATNFHDLLMNYLTDLGVKVAVPEEPVARNCFFQVELPEQAFNYITGLGEEDKFDVMVIDEGQDFREEWFMILQGFLKGGEQGEFYIFADPSQTLFNADSDAFSSFEVSRHCLTRNLRNTEVINSWLTELIGGSGLVATNRGGTPVGFFPWQTPVEELRLVQKELGRLVSQRVRPERVVILSPHVMDKSAFAGRTKIGEWPLYDARAGAGVSGAKVKGKFRPSNAVTFHTIRSFKGLEADIVFLTGIKSGSQACTPNDIYVGSSRARFLLYVFHEDGFSF